MLKILDGTATGNVYTLSSHRNGSKLFGATYAGAYMGGSPYVYNYTQTAANNMYMAFVYPIEGELESLWVDAESWASLDVMKKRTEVAYLTDETTVFGNNIVITNTNPELKNEL